MPNPIQDIRNRRLGRLAIMDEYLQRKDLDITILLQSIHIEPEKEKILKDKEV